LLPRNEGKKQASIVLIPRLPQYSMTVAGLLCANYPISCLGNLLKKQASSFIGTPSH
jgi:hypothetical protein